MRDADLSLEVQVAWDKRPQMIGPRDAVFSPRQPIPVSGRGHGRAHPEGHSWSPCLQALSLRSEEGSALQAVSELEARYSADEKGKHRQVHLFEQFCKTQPEGASQRAFRMYVGLLQKRVNAGTLDASSMNTYLMYVTSAYPQWRSLRTMRAVQAQGSHKGGKRRAPRIPPALKKRLIRYVYSKPFDVTKGGMWAQMCLAAPRCIDVSRLRKDSLQLDRKRTFWSWTKSIRGAIQAKTTPALPAGTMKPPFTGVWWQSQGEEPLAEYNSVDVNRVLKSIASDFTPVPTSTSLRLVFIEDAMAATGGDYEQASRFTVHKSGQVLSAAYDAPRKMSRRM